MKTTDEKLAAIGERLRTQDNRCTANPMFIVQQQRSFGVAPGEGDTDVWLDEDWEEVDEAMSAKLDELDDAYEWELEEDQAAMLKRYLELNGHNLTKPRIYAESWNRCPEMLAVREFLMANAGSDARRAGLRNQQ